MAAAIRFVRIAAESAREGRPAILITHGLSGSGKTTVASRCASAWGAIHLRADVERKRLFGLDPLARTGATIATGIYSPVATRQTYDRLAALARTVVEHGYPAIVDASFLSRWQRERFRGLADAAGVPFVVLDCVAPLNVMLERVASRAARADDASEANRDVIVHQMETAEPLDAEEQVFAVQCDTGALPSGAILSGVLEGVGQRLRLRMPRPHL
jgi:predicted kinase